MSVGVLLFIGSILLVVMIHESGHFLVAKLFGFKATKFFLGFGPTLFSFHRGETEYGVKAIPAGGFVKIVGMNPYEEIAPQDVPRSYPNKPHWQRALLLVAGSATHWVLVFVVLVITAMTLGYPTDTPSNEIASIQTGTSAHEEGIRPGDRIVGVGGEPTTSWDAIRDYIRARPGESASFTIEGEEGTREVTLQIGRAIFDAQGALVAYAGPGEDIRATKPGEELVGFLGVEPERLYQKESFFGAITDSGRRTWNITKESVLGIDDVFRPVFNGDLFASLAGEGEREPDGAVGLVGAGRIAGESVADREYLNFIGLMVYFTIFVGIMNLLPLPPLDGGHLAVVAYEAVTKRKVDVRKLIPVAAAVISFFVILFMAVLYLDLARPIRTPF